jgi:hypothetical protein
MINQRSAIRHRVIPFRSPATQSPLWHSKTQSSITDLVALVAHWASSVVHR